MGQEVTIYSYEKINENESLTHVNVVVIDPPPPPSFRYKEISIKNCKNAIKVERIVINFQADIQNTKNMKLLFVNDVFHSLY